MALTLVKVWGSPGESGGGEGIETLGAGDGVIHAGWMHETTWTTLCCYSWWMLNEEHPAIHPDEMWTWNLHSYYSMSYNGRQNFIYLYLLPAAIANSSLEYPTSKKPCPSQYLCHLLPTTQLSFIFFLTIPIFPIRSKYYLHCFYLCNSPLV